MAIPGIGLQTATALVAAVGDAAEFRNGREMVAWLGLVPRQRSTGGRPTLLGISKRGDRYLRTLLIHGARSSLRYAWRRTDERSRWVLALEQRRGRNVAAVALANKNARTAWAVLAPGARSTSDIPRGPREGERAKRLARTRVEGVAYAHTGSRRFAPPPLRSGPSGDPVFASAEWYPWPEAGFRPAFTGRIRQVRVFPSRVAAQAPFAGTRDDECRTAAPSRQERQHPHEIRKRRSLSCAR